MARITRNFNQDDARLLDAQREQAARSFLVQNPDIAKRLPPSQQSDLYTSIANHLSLNVEPARRQQLTQHLRQAFERAQVNLLQVDAPLSRPASTARQIHDARPDPAKLLAELYENTHRDASNRPLGNVTGHAQERLAASYAALRLIEVARVEGLLPQNPTLVLTKAMVQDKRTSQEFPAAHRMPGDLALQNANGSTTRLTNLFQVELNRAVIDREVFGATDRVNRLANVADSWAENAGMKTALALAATEVARGKIDPLSAMKEIVEPGYVDAITAAYAKIEMNFTVAEQQMVAGAIIDPRTAVPIRGVLDDLKLSSPDKEARAHAKELIRLTLHTYGKEKSLDDDQRNRIDNLIEGIHANEKQLGPEMQVGQTLGIFEQGYYRQRGLQAYEDLMGPIEKLANEAMQAVRKAEATAANPNATDAQIRASFNAVEGYKAAIGRSLGEMESKISDKLQHQFDEEGVRVPVSDVQRYAKHVVDSVKLPSKLEIFQNAANRVDRLEKQYVLERKENGPRLVVAEPSRDNHNVENDYSPRP